MKYIKLFDSLLYDEISFDEYSRLAFFDENITSEMFTKDEIEKIESICGKMNLRIEKDDSGNKLIYLQSKILKYQSELYDINKINDEYYLFQYHNSIKGINKYYKCDQFDGLISCLKKVLHNEY